MTNRLRLGILQVNHDKSVEVGDVFPDDAHRFRDLFDAREQRFDYRIYMTIGGVLPASVEECDGYLITGSPLSTLDDHPWMPGLMEFIRACDAARKPLIGACFGHQAVALALGGKVAKRRGGYNVGVEETRFSTRKRWMEPERDQIAMYVFHEDEVSALPPDCELTGSTPNCAIAAFAKGDHIMTTQSHPEFTPEFMACVLDHSRDHMAPETYAAARADLSRPTDGAVFARWMTRFLGGRP